MIRNWVWFGTFLGTIWLAAMPSVNAQEQQLQKWPLRVGFGISASSYLGDYTDNGTQLSRVYPGGNISIQKASPRYWKLQLVQALENLQSNMMMTFQTCRQEFSQLPLLRPLSGMQT